MTAETDLLPLPSVLLNWPHPTNHAAIRDYAHANLAELQREVEALRAEVAHAVTGMNAALDKVIEHRNARHDAEARAERLAEAGRRVTAAFRTHGSNITPDGGRTRAECEAAMLALDAALDQETTNG